MSTQSISEQVELVSDDVCNTCGCKERHTLHFNALPCPIDVFTSVLDTYARKWKGSTVQNYKGYYRIIGPYSCDCPANLALFDDIEEDGCDG